MVQALPGSVVYPSSQIVLPFYFISMQQEQAHTHKGTHTYESGFQQASCRET